MIIGAGGANLAIVEEFLPGTDLSNVKYDSGSPMPFYRTLYQVARGIADIHERDIVHRDIKPNNMKFDSENYVKIFDFGLAKVSPLPTSTGSLIGTPGFMAPEQYHLPPIIDKPIDVYAFGVMVFLFVSGALPMSAGVGFASPTALPPHGSISVLGFNCPRVAPLIDACLDLNPGARPTMRHISKALEAEILFNAHRATIVNASQTLVLDKSSSKAKATHYGNSVEITYNGYEFTITNVTGHVSINNKQAVVGQILNGAHVITLGSSGQRSFTTFDVSHPEVEL